MATKKMPVFVNTFQGPHSTSQLPSISRSQLHSQEGDLLPSGPSSGTESDSINHYHMVPEFLRKDEIESDKPETYKLRRDPLADVENVGERELEEEVTNGGAPSSYHMKTSEADELSVLSIDRELPEPASGEESSDLTGSAAKKKGRSRSIDGSHFTARVVLRRSSSQPTDGNPSQSGIQSPSTTTSVSRRYRPYPRRNSSAFVPSSEPVVTHVVHEHNAEAATSQKPVLPTSSTPRSLSPILEGTDGLIAPEATTECKSDKLAAEEREVPISEVKVDIVNGVGNIIKQITSGPEDGEMTGKSTPTSYTHVSLLDDKPIPKPLVHISQTNSESRRYSPYLRVVLNPPPQGVPVLSNTERLQEHVLDGPSAHLPLTNNLEISAQTLGDLSAETANPLLHLPTLTDLSSPYDIGSGDHISALPPQWRLRSPSPSRSSHVSSSDLPGSSSSISDDLGEKTLLSSWDVILFDMAKKAKEVSRAPYISGLNASYDVTEWDTFPPEAMDSSNILLHAASGSSGSGPDGLVDESTFHFLGSGASNLHGMTDGPWTHPPPPLTTSVESAYRPYVIPSNMRLSGSIPSVFGAAGLGIGNTDGSTPMATQTSAAEREASSLFRSTPGRKKKEASFVCPIPGCGSTFTRSFNLKGHIRSHNEYKPFKCDWPGCGKGFVREHDCKRHRQLHSNYRPFTCEPCGKQFARMDALNRHLRSESGQDCAAAVQRTQAANASARSEFDMDVDSPVLPQHVSQIVDAADGSSKHLRLKEGVSADLNSRQGMGPPQLVPATTEGPRKDVATLVARLGRIFEDVVRYKQLLACKELIAQKLLDLFQWLLNIPRLDTGFRRSLIVATQRLSKQTGLYPACYSLKDVEMVGDHPVNAGSFADIYKGSFRGQHVCMKAIRIYQATQVDHFLKLCSKEAILWGQLSHPNVLPIYGLYRFQSRICLVSPWMENGDVNHFVTQNPSANRLLLAADIAEGLLYLHANGIIHGDLKAANILVTQSGRACLADFGLSSVSDAKILNWTSHSCAASKGGSMRWQAPELFELNDDEAVHNSEASDVYAWSCVCYEIFTGEVPFANISRDSAVMLQVRSGKRPQRPLDTSNAWGIGGLTDDFWSLMEECWKGDPVERPSMHQVLSRLSHMLPVDQRSPEGDILSPARFRLGATVGGHVDISSFHDLDTIINAVDLETSLLSHTGIIM